MKYLVRFFDKENNCLLEIISLKLYQDINCIGIKTAINIILENYPVEYCKVFEYRGNTN